MEWWGNLGVLSPSYDTDAQAFITLVEAADGQALEAALRDAINAFVVGCKADGIWTAIKACCILAGARTLAGALVPLVGTAPTNYNFVAGDYNRKNGLVGNGTTKYINSNYTGSADPQNSRHLAVHISSAITNGGVIIGVENATQRNTLYSSPTVQVALSQPTIDSTGILPAAAIGLVAASRSASNVTSWRVGSSAGTFSTASASSTFGSVYVFARNDNGSLSAPCNGRINFYSIGTNIDLTLLSARVSTLISALAAAIP